MDNRALCTVLLRLEISKCQEFVVSGESLVSAE